MKNSRDEYQLHKAIKGADKSLSFSERLAKAIHAQPIAVRKYK